jgi:heat shock protein HslJ
MRSRMPQPFARLRALLFTVLFACSGDSADLDGHHYILQSADGFQPIAGSSVHLVFDDDKLSVSGGCNNLGGAYHVDGGHLVVTDLWSTQRGCDSALLAQDERLGAFLRARPQLARSGAQLALSLDGMVLRFLDREIADPDRPLLDTVWVIDTVIDDQSFGTSPATGNPAVQFASDGTVHIRSTCNGGGGRYTVKGDQLTLLQIGYTEEACNDPVAAGLEQKIQAVLYSGTLSFEIEARRLTLMRDSIGLSAQAQ